MILQVSYYKLTFACRCFHVCHVVLMHPVHKSVCVSSLYQRLTRQSRAYSSPPAKTMSPTIINLFGCSTEKTFYCLGSWMPGKSDHAAVLLGDDRHRPRWCMVMSPAVSRAPGATNTHARTHPRTHARTHERTHARTPTTQIYCCYLGLG